MRPRHWPQQLHLLVASALFLAVLCFVYQIAGRANRRFDLTQEKLYSVSKETVEILGQMREKGIRLRAYFADEDPARKEWELLLKNVSVHHPRFRYEFIDPDRVPSAAQRDHVTSYRTSVIEFDGRRDEIQGLTEEALANALIRLAHPERKTLCFSAGHGEPSLDDNQREGLSGWRQVLEDRQYSVKEIQIMGQGIPAECSVVVLSGPRYELLPGEVELLQKFSKRGKGFLFLIDPMDPGEGKTFQTLAKSFGLTLGEDVIVDKVSRVFGGDYLTPLVAQYADHPATKQFRAGIFLPIARTVQKAPELPEGALPAGRQVRVTELAFTMQGSWAERDLQDLENGTAELAPKEDPVGPLSVAAAAEIGDGRHGGRAVFVGDSDFVTNVHLGLAGNRDFALNLLQWLVRDDRWISIRAREPRFEPLFLRAHESAGAAAFAVLGLPFTLLVAGSARILVRKKSAL